MKTRTRSTSEHGWLNAVTRQARIRLRPLATLFTDCALAMMQNYLTNVWELRFTHVATLLNVWKGASLMLQVFMLFLVDTLVGNFLMLVFSGFACTVGISIIAVSTPPVFAKFTGMCNRYESLCINHAQKALFYIGMVLIAVGKAGHHVSLHPFFKEQDDKEEEVYNKHPCTKFPDSFSIDFLSLIEGPVPCSTEPCERTPRSHARFPREFNDNDSIEYAMEESAGSGMTEEDGNKPAENENKNVNEEKNVNDILDQNDISGICLPKCERVYTVIGTAIPVIGALVFVITVKRWSLLFGIPAIFNVFATLLFFSGWQKYIKVPSQGSPLTTVCRVFVASCLKISKPILHHSNNLYIKDGDDCHSFSNTRCLSFLEKAAFKLPHVSTEEQVKNRWKLCSVGEVEDVKIGVRIFPIWMTFICWGIVASIGNTYFLEQADQMNHKVGKWKAPVLLLVLLRSLVNAMFASITTKILKKSQNIATPPSGITVAMMLSILCCIISAIVEAQRLSVVKRHGLLDKPDDPIPMSMFWLVFQFVLLGCMNSIFEKSIAAFYWHQGPKSVRRYAKHFAQSASGFGHMFGVVSVHVASKLSKFRGKPSWFQPTLNRSRLDLYYWALAGLSLLNLVVFVMLACSYSYMKPQADGEEDSPFESEVEVVGD